MYNAKSKFSHRSYKMDFKAADSILLASAAVCSTMNWVLYEMKKEESMTSLGLTRLGLGDMYELLFSLVLQLQRAIKIFKYLFTANTIINWVYKVLDASWLLFGHESHATCTKRKSEIPTKWIYNFCFLCAVFFSLYNFHSVVNKHLDWNSKSTWFHYFYFSFVCLLETVAFITFLVCLCVCFFFSRSDKFPDIHEFCY